MALLASCDGPTMGVTDKSIESTSGITSSSTDGDSSTEEEISSSIDSSSTSEEDISEEYEKIEHISLDKREIYVEVNKRSDSLVVTYYPDNNISIDDKEVTWSSSDIENATVDEYGRVSGHKVGDTLIKCVTKIDNRHATCLVHVVESIENINKEYRLVSDISTLKAGDIIVIASPSSSVTAGNDTVGMYMHPVVTSFSDDLSSITSLGDNTAEFILDGDNKDGFTLENNEGKYLATTNEKKVTFVNNKGNIHWLFIMEEEGLVIESTSNVPGWIMYNAKYERFTTYESNPQVDLLLPSIYRLEIVL